jgi:SOS-response transcriptional repressor LexA
MMTATLPPSPRMLALAQAVEKITERDGRPPTYMQLGDELNVSFTRARQLARAARDRGIIEIRDGRQRGIRVIDNKALRQGRRRG